MTWRPHATNPKYIELQGVDRALVRIDAMPNGRYLWQFRTVAGNADTVDKAKDYVEAGAEYFAVMRRNPYSN